MQRVHEIAFGFGFMVLPWLVLLLAVLFARGKLMVVVAGVVAAILMVLQFLLSMLAAGIASATSGSQKGYGMLGILFVVFVVSLVVYFPVAITAVERRTRRRNHKP